MHQKKKTRQRSIGIQSTELTELDFLPPLPKLVKKTGFRNLLQPSVTIVAHENEGRRYCVSSETRCVKSVQANLDYNEAYQNPRFREKHNLVPSKRPKGSRHNDKFEGVDKDNLNANPGTSKMASAAVSSFSVFSEINLKENEGSLAVIYNYEDKPTDSLRSSNVAHLFETQSRRFSDETLLLIEDFQSYDYGNTRRQENRSAGSKSLLCCHKNKRSSVDVLTRPLILPLENIKEKEEEFVCRICHEGEEEEPLIQPCLCKGSVGNVHAKCLKVWLEQSNTSRCELCNYPYAIRQTKKYSKCYSIKVFLKTVVDKRSLAYDLTSFVVITPLTIVGVAMCIQASIFSNAELGISSADQQMGNITKAGMIVLSTTIVAAYGIWLYTLASFHYKSWKKWYNNAYDVEVLPVRMTSEERLEATLKLSEGINRRQLSRSQGSAMVSIFNTHSNFQRRISAPPTLTLDAFTISSRAQHARFRCL